MTLTVTLSILLFSAVLALLIVPILIRQVQKVTVVLDTQEAQKKLTELENHVNRIQKTLTEIHELTGGIYGLHNRN